jgi:hypothetical protein
MWQEEHQAWIEDGKYCARAYDGTFLELSQLAGEHSQSES